MAALAGVSKMAVDSGILLNIPHAISEETLDYLYKLNDPLLTHGFPEPDNEAGWSRLQELVERHAMPQSDLLVERFAPAIAGFPLGGVPVLDIRPRNWKDKSKVAIYTHGGGFTLYSAASTLGRAALFADDAALRVISVDYTLAPHATFEEINDQVVAVVTALLNQGYRPEDTLMFGDSSGGGLTLSVILKLRNAGVGLPAAAVLISPCIHISSADDTKHSSDAPSPYGCDEKTTRGTTTETGHRHPQNVRSSPVYANFSRGFPPTLIQGSTQEVLLNEFFRLYHALDLAGVQVRLDLYEGTTHGFQFRNPEAPEAKIARRKMSDFVHLRLAQRGRPVPSDRASRAMVEISKVARPDLEKAG